MIKKSYIDMMNKIEPDEGYEERLKVFLQKNYVNNEVARHKRFSAQRIFLIAMPIACAFAILISVAFFSQIVSYAPFNNSFSPKPFVLNYYLDKADYVVKGTISAKMPQEKYTFRLVNEGNRIVSVTTSKISIRIDSLIKGELSDQVLTAFVVSKGEVINSGKAEMSVLLPDSSFLNTKSNYLFCLGNANSNITVVGGDKNPLFLVDGIDGIFKQDSLALDAFTNNAGSSIYNSDLNAIAKR